MDILIKYYNRGREKYLYKEKSYNLSIIHSAFFSENVSVLAQAKSFKCMELLGNTTDWKIRKAKKLPICIFFIYIYLPPTKKISPRHTLTYTQRRKKKTVSKNQNHSNARERTHTTINISNIKAGKADQSKHTLGTKGE